jgi:hypothetical protein
MNSKRTREEQWWRRVTVVLVALVFAGCAAGTREATFGPLEDGSSLVRLVVSSDLDRIRGECLAAGRDALGCQFSAPARMNSVPVRRITVVRYAEALPSPLTFAIDANALCRAVVSLQVLADLCP